MNRSSWKTAHEDYHPWPKDSWDLENHLNSHHFPNRKGTPVSGATVIQGRGFEKTLHLHGEAHKHPLYDTPRNKRRHNHDDDDGDFDIDIPENIETIAPTYVTGSWHQSFVETFDTNKDEESPDTILNPSDELKNGRPRANDLPNQSAQLIPGMLMDHDQMGGSGTASGSF